MYKLKRIIYPGTSQSHVHYYVVVPDEEKLNFRACELFTNAKRTQAKENKQKSELSKFKS